MQTSLVHFLFEFDRQAIRIIDIEVAVFRIRKPDVRRIELPVQSFCTQSIEINGLEANGQTLSRTRIINW